ncbi:Transcriptional regulator [Mucinivorans hirudinis]|uniref:Transcriptional regulator n=1 Tax=Mucinivorans hirudinis TaxID=1433126 RepID=A0A060RDF6_9BACT|nr:Transcriptional regulator [Mucinivorans hirudinis]
MSVKSKIQKVYYTMGEVCEMFDLPPSNIRFWEKNFSFIKPKKNAKGNRLFSPDDVEQLKLVYHLIKDKGMTLAGADKYIKDNKVAARKESNVVEILQRVRTSLVDIRNEINALEKHKANEIIIPTIVAEEELAPQKEPPRYIELTLF